MVDPATHLIAIVLMALVARGIAFALAEDQVFAGIGKSLRRLPGKMHKPLGTCGNCAVWLWGTLAIIGFSALPIVEWYPIFILPYYLDYVEIPSLLWLLPLYWLGAAGLQDLLDP